MTKSEPDQFDAYLALAHAVADKSSTVILPHFRADLAVDHKGGSTFDPVTIADRDAEAAIRQALEEAYPDHGIVGEEFGTVREDAPLCWIVDPIDGTRAFIMGQPMWGTLIGLASKGTPLLGLMNQPFTGERFWSGKTQSFYSRGGETQRISVRKGGALQTATLASTAPELFADEERGRFEALRGAVRLTRFGGDCYNYCLLAMGQIDLVVEAGLKPFDIAPLIPIIQRAGGIVTTWDGGDAAGGGRIIAAGSADLHQAALQYLSGPRFRP